MASKGHIEPFDPKVGNWESYLDRFECYRIANGIDGDDVCRATFLSTCGQAVFDIARDLVAPSKLLETPLGIIKARLTEYFTPKTSAAAHRCAFHQRNQKEGESITEYLTVLRRAARDCHFTDLKSVLLDRLLCGLRDESVKRALLLLKTLTYESALEEALRVEAANLSLRELRVGLQSHTSCHSDAVHHGSTDDQSDRSDDGVYNARANRKPHHYRASPRRSQKSPPRKSCAGCGGTHARRDCQFRDAICHACGKAGHLAKVCRSSQGRDVPCESQHTRGSANAPSRSHRSKSTRSFEHRPRYSNDTDVSEDYTNRLYIHQGLHPCPKIKATVFIEGRACQMEVDSGSALSIVSWSTFQQVCPRFPAHRLQKCTLQLFDFQRRRVPVVGIATVQVKYKKFSGRLNLLVVEGRRTSLIGLDWFAALGIDIVGVNEVERQPVMDFEAEFPEVFRPELGCYKGPPVSFNLNPAVQPIRVKPRRCPVAFKPKIDEQIDKLLAQGILEPVPNAQWETPIVTPLKPDGSVRLCADYKCTINRALQPHAYPVPVVSHLLASVSGGRVFAKIDLAQAYQQLPVDAATAEAQTIVTHRGAFKVNRLQFGVSVAPGIFQELMERLLRGLPGVVPYFDDVLIAGTSDLELATRVREVLRRLQDVGLRLKKEKCEFFVPSVQFLGYRVDAEGIHPAQDKVAAVRNAPPPRSKKELQSFLGLLNFYHAFLPNKAALAEPLHRLLDKSAPWSWGRRENAAFQAVKALLTSDAVLVHFDEKKPLVLACDASPYGIGAVLSHRLPSGREAPIAFYSRTLSAAERNYAQIDREALAIIAAVKKFHDFIYGQEFEIVTDHKPLLGIFTADRQTPQILSPRMMRWAVLLSAYSFRLLHRPGKTIGHADALSRLPLPSSGPPEVPLQEALLIEELPQPPLSVADVAFHTSRDRLLGRVYNHVWRGWPSGTLDAEFQPFLSRSSELSVNKGCLLWGNRVVVPPPLRQRVLDALHEGHPGIVKMKAIARSYVWWPGLDQQIERWVRTCQPCQESRAAAPNVPVHPWEKPRGPWSRIHVDFAGPFQGRTLLIVVDAFSKWLEVLPVTSMTSAVVIRCLDRLFATFGLPDLLVSDNGTQFTSAEFQRFLDERGIRHVTSAPFHPETNGQAERMVRTVKDSLRRLGEGNFPARLANFLLQQHTSPHAATGKSPAELLMGRQLSTRLSRLHPDLAPDVYRDPIATGSPRSFGPGDAVYARNYGAGPHWVPAVVVRATGPISYEVRDDTGQVRRRHLAQLRRRWPAQDEELQRSPVPEQDQRLRRSPVPDPEPPVQRTPVPGAGPGDLPAQRDAGTRESRPIVVSPMPSPARDTLRQQTAEPPPAQSEVGPLPEQSLVPGLVEQPDCAARSHLSPQPHLTPASRESPDLEGRSPSGPPLPRRSRRTRRPPPHLRDFVV